MPGKPHVRVWQGDVYIERVPGYWVDVIAAVEWEQLNEVERRYMVDKALKVGLDVPTELLK